MARSSVRRFALVVATQCAELPRLDFLPRVGRDLHQSLTRDGVWQAARTRDEPLVDPTIAQLKLAIKRAFAKADRHRATLLIAFVGHGMSTGQHDLWLLARDSPSENPDSDNSFNVTETLRERLKEAHYLDGLIMFIDACEAGEGVRGAAQRWPDVMGESGRIELLAASGTGSAYSACFSQTLTRTFGQGLPRSGSTLQCADLKHEVAKACSMQEPQHLSYSWGGRSANADPGLWLTHNRAYAGGIPHPLLRTGLIDYLTREVIATGALHEALARIVEASHCRRLLLSGPAGCGKSTMLALLIRPSAIDGLPINHNFVSAAVFVDSSTTLDVLAEQLVEQLCARVGRFRETHQLTMSAMTEWDQATRTSFSIQVVEVLRRCHAEGRRVRIIIDGLDELSSAAVDPIVEALDELIADGDQRLSNVRLICGVRAGTPVEQGLLSHGYDHITVDAPGSEDLVEALENQGHSLTNVEEKLLRMEGTHGGWLIARLITEAAYGEQRPRAAEARSLSVNELLGWRLEQVEMYSDRPGISEAVLGVVLAGGVGPAIPISLAQQALRALGLEIELPELRDVIVAMGAMVCRGKPGEPDELLGIAHTLFLDALTRSEVSTQSLRLGHISIIDALEQMCGQSDPAALAYRDRVGPRHHLGCNRHGEAIDTLTALDGPNAADNRDRWARFLPEFQQLAAHDARRLAAEHQYAHWVGKSGDASTAVNLFSAILEQLNDNFEDGHGQTLAARQSLARWTGKSGDVATARRQAAQLVADCRRIFGPVHLETLMARHEDNLWLGETEAFKEALADAEDLADLESAELGADHPRTLATRYLKARWRRESGDLEGAREEFSQLLHDRRHILGEDDPETLSARSDLARTRRRLGNYPEMLQDLEQLRADRTRILGGNHPDTMITRSDHGNVRAQNGDIDAGLSELEAVLENQISILGHCHRDTDATKARLARWRNI